MFSISPEFFRFGKKKEICPHLKSCQSRTIIRIQYKTWLNNWNECDMEKNENIDSIYCLIGFSINFI